MSEEKYFFTTILLRSFGFVSAYGAETFIVVFVDCWSIWLEADNLVYGSLLALIVD